MQTLLRHLFIIRTKITTRKGGASDGKIALFSLLSDRFSSPLVSLSIKRPCVGCKFAGFSGKTCVAGVKALILQM